MSTWWVEWRVSWCENHNGWRGTSATGLEEEEGNIEADVRVGGLGTPHICPFSCQRILRPRHFMQKMHNLQQELPCDTEA